MKKVISLLLVAILVINFVFSTFTLRISSSTDEKIISVGLIWNDISFTYDVGTSSWNPSTHSYEHDKDVANWTDKSGQITAYNYSNLPISIDISFECAATPNGTAVLKFSNPSFVLNESLGSTDCTFISAEGVPESDAVLGKIVVFIDIHTHDWKNGACVGCGEACESNILVNGTDISEYKIAYSSSLRNGAGDAAKRLAEHIQCVLGKNVEIAIDAESNTEKAIIISDTLPDGSGNLELDTFTSAIQYVNGSIWISATNQHTLDLAIDKFIADSTPKTAGAEVDLDYSGTNKVIIEADELGALIPLFSANESTSVIIPSEASRLVLYARDKIQLGVEALTQKTLPEGESSPFEILIGDTGRAESIALKATLSADEYAIKTVGKKIVIVASSDAFLYEAAKYFCDNYLKAPYLSIDGDEVILFAKDIDVRRVGDKTSIHYNVSLGTHLNASGAATYTLNNQKYGATDADPRIYRRQGGCFNGEIYYQALISKNEEIAVVARQNVITGELIYSEPRVMEHANDATYNPYNDRLYVGNGKTVWVYNGTTMEFIESFTLAYSTARFSYSPERHKYVVASYRIYDESFNYTGTYIKSQLSTLYGDLTLSSQGTACDDTFIYSLLIEGVGSSKYNAYIGVLDWYGNTLAFVNVELPDKIEPENISIVDGKIYIAACSTQPVATLYEISFD